MTTNPMNLKSFRTRRRTSYNNLQTWTTEELKKAHQDYTNRMEMFNKSEKSTWTFKHLEQLTDLINKELQTR